VSPDQGEHQQSRQAEAGHSQMQSTQHHEQG
jgi:hypothetical protein